MLHKSFKPAKCKTSLKMASSRTKLLKNKKEVQVKQLRRELAQLLESGQEQTAIIRVEHVVREEKMMTAYELIEIFCELIHARMQIIESQKKCPIDLKEAVASVVFASPRCSDIPELVDVRKHFTAKYGKEFVSAAVELRPECGVNRNLVEKLSAKAPDGQTKLKILTAIAEEHNIKWDPKLFGEKIAVHQEDLLNGPNSFQNSSQTHVQPSNVQSSYYDSGPPDVHISLQNEVKQEDSVNVRASDIGTSYGSQNVAPVQANVYANPHPDLKSSGAEMQGMGHIHGHSAAMGRQNWNMEFKDATSAAQAAAESAEMASMAARAAAELSSMGRITTQNSSQSQGSSAHLSTHEFPRTRPPSSFDASSEASFQDSRSQGSSAYHSTHELPRRRPSSSFDGSVEGSFKDSRPSTYHESQGSSHPSTQELPRKQYGPNSDVSSTKGSFKDSRPSSHGSRDEGSFNPVGSSDIIVDDDEPEDLATVMRRLAGNVNSSRPSTVVKPNADSFAKVASPERPEPQPQAAHKNAQHNSFDESSAVRHSGNFEGESSDKVKDGPIYENVDDLEDTRFEEAVDLVSSYAHSSVTSRDRRDALESSSQRSSGENPFAEADFKGVEDFHEDHKPKNDTADVVFDDYDEGESYGFDLDKEPESDIYPHSPHRSFPSYSSPKWSPPGSKVDPSPFSSVFVETSDDSTVQPPLDELPPIVFDDVSGPHSESEEEQERSKPQHVFSPPSRNSSFGLTRNDSNTSDKSVGRRNRNQPLHSSKMPLFDERNDGTTEIPDSVESNVDNDNAFYLGNLPGGRRNKTSRLPPYTRSPSRESSSAKPVAAAAYGREADTEVDKPSRNRYSPPAKVTSDGENDSEDEVTEITKSLSPYRSSNTRSSLDRPKLDSEVGKRSTSRASVASASVASLDSDPENDPLPRVATTKPRFAGLSRRTKGTPPSHFKSTFGSEDEESPPKRSSFSNRSSDSKSKFAYDDDTARGRINTNSSFQSSSSPPRRSSNLISTFASENAEDTQEHRVDAWRISNVKSSFVSEEAEIEELSPEVVKPSRKTSIPDRNSKYMEAQERRSYTEAQERREDRTPSSSRVSYPTKTSGNVQSGTEYSDSRRGYDSRSSLRSDKNANLKFKSGSEEAGRSQEHNKSSSRGSSYIPETSLNVKVPDSFVSEEAEIEELIPEVKPSRRTSIPDRNSKYVEAQERRSYAEGSSSSLKLTSAFDEASRNQERREDRKPSSSRASYPTKTSGNVQSGTGISDIRRGGYDSRSRGDKNSDLKFNSGSEEAGRSQEHQADNRPSSRGGSSYIPETSSDVKVPDSRRSSDRVRAGKISPKKVDPEPKSPRPLAKDSSEASSGSPKTSREDSLNNRASHVHPKLPDCDSFAAHFEALRAKRQ